MIRLVRKLGFGFGSGVIAGVALVCATVIFVNQTPVADWIISPLLIPDSPGSAEAIVVLGAGVIGDCVPNHNGLRRVLRGVREWRQQPSALLLFTGGTGAPCPVAVAMARAAVELGVPADRVRVESTSRNTRENAELSAALLQGWGVSRVLLVTDRMHMRRANGTFERLGLAGRRATIPIYEGHEDNLAMLIAGLREYAAFAYYWTRGWISPHRPAHQAMNEATMPPPKATPSPRTGPIVILGASYAASWPLNDVGGVPVLNRGIAGQQSFELLDRFDADVVSAAPRAVVLWGFINDIFRSPPDGMDTTLTRLKRSYTLMIERARAHGIEPILATEVTARPPVGGFVDTMVGWAGFLLRKPAYQDQINRHVLAVNQWLIETAAREQLVLLHFQAVLSESGGRRRPAFAQPDGSHITVAGYDMLTSYARPLLQEHLVDR